MQRVEEEDGEQRPEERARIVAKALKPEGSASVFLIHRRRDERIARRGAGAGAKPVQQPCAEHALPDRGKPHQRLGDRRQEIAGQRDGFSLLQLVRQRAGKALHDILRGLSKAVHQANDAAACFQRLRQKDRQDRVEHLRGDVSEQAGEGEKERVPRKPGKVSLDR